MQRYQKTDRYEMYQELFRNRLEWIELLGGEVHSFVSIVFTTCIKYTGYARF